jgi:hypothetical protein
MHEIACVCCTRSSTKPTRRLELLVVTLLKRRWELEFWRNGTSGANQLEQLRSIDLSANPHFSNIYEKMWRSLMESCPKSTCGRTRTGSKGGVVLLLKRWDPLCGYLHLTVMHCISPACISMPPQNGGNPHELDTGNHVPKSVSFQYQSSCASK